MMIQLFNMKTGMITACLIMMLVACGKSKEDKQEYDYQEMEKRYGEKLINTMSNADSKDEDKKKDMDEVSTDKDIIDGWMLACPWTKWESEQGRFVVHYPAFLKENREQMRNHYDCLVAEWKRLRFIAKRNRDSMSLEGKYEELKGGAVTSSIGYDSFLLAGKLYDDMRFFEKEIKGESHWYYLRVEFPAELTSVIDPLLQYVKEYQLEQQVGLLSSQQ